LLISEPGGVGVFLLEEITKKTLASGNAATQPCTSLVALTSGDTKPPP
jgi:hypothetical protein